MASDIRALVADLPTYGYRRVHALLRRVAEQTGREASNPKRVYYVMKMHRLLLKRDGERHEERRHVGRVAIDLRNNHWRSGLEITYDNGVKVVNRVPGPMAWLTDNPVLSEAEGGSCYNAHNTRAFVRGIGLIPRTTPIGRPQSNGMAEAFVRIL